MTLQEQYNDAMRYGIHLKTVREGDYRFDYVLYQSKVVSLTKHNGEVKEIKTVHHY
ncbi:hypothetical protein D3C87_1939940 [compost metagenome]